MNKIKAFLKKPKEEQHPLAFFNFGNLTDTDLSFNRNIGIGVPLLNIDRADNSKIEVKDNIGILSKQESKSWFKKFLDELIISGPVNLLVSGIKKVISFLGL